VFETGAGKRRATLHYAGSKSRLRTDRSPSAQVRLINI
jgi:hypothetical protein